MDFWNQVEGMPPTVKIAFDIIEGIAISTIFSPVLDDELDGGRYETLVSRDDEILDCSRATTLEESLKTHQSNVNWAKTKVNSEKPEKEEEV